MSMGINKFFLVGNCGSDPEALGSGCRFSVAYSEKWEKDGEMQESTSWFGIKVWGKQAEFLMANLKKGAKVMVEGKLRVNTVGEGEEKRSYTDVIADRVVLGSFAGGVGGSEATAEEAHQAKPKAKFSKPAASKSKLPF